MPLVNGTMHYWWNWSARDPANGRLKTFFTNGLGNVCTPDQCFMHAKTFFPHLDLRGFSCELTTVLPPNKRALVPKEYRMNGDQLKLLQVLQGPDKIEPVNRSILYGKQISESEKRGDRAPDRVVRQLPIIQRE